MKRDNAYLQHMLDATSNMEKFMEGVTKEEFLKNVEKQYAVLRGFEIIGEAAKNVSRALKKKYPYIPWREITGMRNKLIHQYFGVNLDLVWETVKTKLPELKNRISIMLKETKESIN